MTDKALNQDINYLHGQVHGLQALVLAIAGSTMSQTAFRQQGQARLETVRTMLLGLPVPDRTIAGIDAIDSWLSNVT